MTEPPCRTVTQARRADRKTTNILHQFQSFDRGVRTLLINQFAINASFFMLMPYLALYLSGKLALGAWAVGLIMGMRNFSQQGMFLIGGTIVDRLGYRKPIIAGCALRTAGFALLGIVNSLPALVAASIATGFAGALFLPAIRIGLGQESGQRRIEAFALSNLVNRTGILTGTLIGLALTGLDFRLTCLASTLVFAVLTVVQIRTLPAGTTHDRPGSVLQDWRAAASNPRLIRFSLAMTGAYVLSFQTYLALPLEARRLAGNGAAGTVLVALLFTISGLLALLAQLHITRWFRSRLGPDRSLPVGVLVLASAFVPLAFTVSPTAGDLRYAPLLVSAALLAIGTMVVFPFEMDTVVRLCRNRLVATHYGLYSTIAGIGILAGNVFIGTILDLARSAHVPALPWLGLTLLGTLCAWGLRSY